MAVIGPAHWAPDGSSVLYLHYPEDRRQLNAIREYTLDQDQDALVGKTSQFVHFGVNGDGSVFAGASRNGASPHVLLLLRAAKRELTLCEHRASDPTAVAPIFSADSQRVFFQSDMHGKPAIYRVRVDQFVEKTESGGSVTLFGLGDEALRPGKPRAESSSPPPKARTCLYDLSAAASDL